MNWHKATSLVTLILGGSAALTATQIPMQPQQQVFADEEVVPAQQADQERNNENQSVPLIIGFSEEQEATIQETYEIIRSRVPRIEQLQTLIRHYTGDSSATTAFAETFYNVELTLPQILAASRDELNNATLCGNFPERLREKFDRFDRSRDPDDLRATSIYLIMSMLHFSHEDHNLDVIVVYDSALSPREKNQEKNKEKNEENKEHDQVLRSNVDLSLRGIMLHEYAHLLLDSDLPRAGSLLVQIGQWTAEYQRQTGKRLSSESICADAWVSRYAANNYGIGMQNYQAAAGAVPLVAQLLRASGTEENRELAQDLEETLLLSHLGWMYGEEAAECITEAILNTGYDLGDIARRKVAAAARFLEETARE